MYAVLFFRRVMPLIGLLIVESSAAPSCGCSRHLGVPPEVFAVLLVSRFDVRPAVAQLGQVRYHDLCCGFRGLASTRVT